MFVDVKNFKIVNDVFGTDFGDLAIQQVADRLRDDMNENCNAKPESEAPKPEDQPENADSKVPYSTASVHYPRMGQPIAGQHPRSEKPACSVPTISAVLCH